MCAKSLYVLEAHTFLVESASSVPVPGYFMHLHPKYPLGFARAALALLFLSVAAEEKKHATHKSSIPKRDSILILVLMRRKVKICPEVFAKTSLKR